MDIYKKTGTVTYIGEPDKKTQYLSKRTFKIRFTDIDFANKIQQRVIKFDLINDNMTEIDGALLDDQVDVEFYIEGRDFTKDGKTTNYTSLVAIKVDIIRSSQRDTDEDRKAVITNEGREYKPLQQEATDDQLAGIDDGKDLLSIWDEKKDKYGLPDQPVPGVTEKSKKMKPEEDPFAGVQAIIDIPKDLPF